MVLAFVVAPARAAAQLPTASGQFRSGGVYYEKFFQASNDGPREDVWAAMMEVRLEDQIPVDHRLRAYARIELVQYRKLGLSPGALYGFKRRGRSHAFDFYGAVQWNRPRSDIGDVLEKADRVGGGGSYTYRVVAGLHLTGRGEYKEEFLKPQRVTASRVFEVGGVVAYRALAGKLVPEVAYYEGQRRTGKASSGYVQESGAAGLRIALIPRLDLTARYLERVRRYEFLPNPTAVMRVDRRKQVDGEIDIALGGGLVLNLSGSVEKARSTRGRSFVTRTFEAGFTVIY